MKKEHYKIRISCLSQLYSIGKKISIIELDTTASVIRTYQLEKIVEKILLHVNSILVLVKYAAENEHKELDFSVIASATRNIMESTNYYFYIAERKISNDEISFRYSLSNLNYFTNISDIIKKLEYPQHSFKARMIEIGTKLERRNIRKHIAFQQADPSTKAHLLSGRKQGFRMRRTGILEKNKESAIYNILSNSVHGLHIGLGNNSLNYSIIYNNHIDCIMLLMLAFEISIIYTANVLKDYLDLRKKLYRYLNKEEKKFINEMKSLDMLNEYLEYEKVEFGRPLFDFEE